MLRDAKMGVKIGQVNAFGTIAGILIERNSPSLPKINAVVNRSVVQQTVGCEIGLASFTGCWLKT